MFLKSSLLLSFCFVFCVISVSRAQDDIKLDVVNLEVPQAIARPKNAGELQRLRKYYDQTVWRDERLAEQYERWIVGTWNAFLFQPDKWQVIEERPIDEIIVGQPTRSQELDWDITTIRFESPAKLNASQVLKVIKQLKDAGYEIVETEWHHSEFIPPKAGKPARSVVSMLMHITQGRTNTRFIVRGNLKFVWSTKPNASGLFTPTSIDTSDVVILERSGSPAFREVKQAEFSVIPEKPLNSNTLHPVMLQDMNDDNLPEVIVAGQNKIYWNRGDWQFEEDTFCQFPSKQINSGLIADFNNDGIADFFCAVKQGFPRIYFGSQSGEFSAPPRILKFAASPLTLPVAVTAGDIDHDGDLDIFIGQNKVGYQTGEIPSPYYDANDSFPSYLLTNNGDGSFTDVTAVSGLGKKRNRRNYAASFVDFDADGHLDLLLTNDFCGNDLFLNDGAGVFTDISTKLLPRSSSYGMSHTFGDYDLNGTLDFITIGMSSTTARRLDKLQLGRPDLPEHNEQRKHMGYGNRLFLNNGDHFQQASFNDDVARTGWSWGSTTLDFDRDGDPDIYIVNGQTSGKTTQDYCTQFWCHDIYHSSKGITPVVKDFFSKVAPLLNGNHMSWNGYEHNALLMNLDGQGFVNVGFLMNCASEFDSRFAASADLDLDGQMDIVFEHKSLRNRTDTLHFLKNEWHDQHHWIGVHLKSADPKNSPLGAKVEAISSDAGRTWIQHVVTGHSVWAQHPNTVHFGLGDTSSLDAIRVTWPNGTVTKIDNPDLDAYLTVEAAAN